MLKEFQVQGCIAVPMEVPEEEFWDKFISFIEANNWWFSGNVNEIVDGFYLNPDGTKGKHIFDE